MRSKYLAIILWINLTGVVCSARVESVTTTPQPPAVTETPPPVSQSSCTPPAKIPLSNTGEYGIWSDFKSVRYELDYDLNKAEVRVKTIMLVETSEKGRPLFDLVEDPISITIDRNSNVGHLEQIIPGTDSKVRMINHIVEPGLHRIEILSKINKGVTFRRGNSPTPGTSPQSVESRFQFFDMRDRSFLEQYLPTNLEYDQYRMRMKVRIIGGTAEYELFTNGKKTNVTDSFDEFNVEFPRNFTASSPFFHLAPKGKYKQENFIYPSIDGRSIPVTIYSKADPSKFQPILTNFKSRLKGTPVEEGLLPMVERRFGPWPHDGFVVHAINKLRGGMEFPGGAESSHLALQHEVVHNYFGRSIMPCDGASGWVDEAIASWNDFQSVHPLLTFVGYFPNKKKGIMHHGDESQRATPKGSYLEGRHFVTEVAKRLEHSPKGRLTFDNFLKFFYNKRKNQQITAEDFLNDLKEFSSIDFHPIAEKYIYSKI